MGLGNPGEEHEGTRHNVGFWVVERLGVVGDALFSVRKKLESEILVIGDLVLAKPTTYMNSSGRAVSKLLGYYKVSLDEFYVVHDDLDIALGEYKIQKGKGPKDHKGVESIEGNVGSKSFWRVRVGVENRGKENGRGQVGRAHKISGRDYVLRKFSASEKEKIDKVIEKVVVDLKARLL